MEFTSPRCLSKLRHNIATWRAPGGRGDEDEVSVCINSYAHAWQSLLVFSGTNQCIDKAVSDMFILRGQALGSM